jgi:anti-sigma factor RsiW
MDCRECAETLSSYLDGEVTGEIASLLESHLERCSTCAAELRSLKASALWVEEHARELELRPEIWQRVYERISTAPLPSKAEGLLDFILGRRWLTAAVTASLALALTIGLWSVYRYQAEERELSRYMSAYIRVRESQGPSEGDSRITSPDKRIDAASTQTRSARNPFAVVNYHSNENPFRSEDR